MSTTALRFEIVQFHRNSQGQPYAAILTCGPHQLVAVQTRAGLVLDPSSSGPNCDEAYWFLRDLEDAGLAEFVFHEGAYTGLGGDRYWRGPVIPGLEDLVPRAA